VISIVVNFFNNRREAENTLYSMTRGYQKDLADLPYEVIVIDNGAAEPLSEERVRSFGPEFRYQFVAQASVSPAQAINAACRGAAGDELMVVIDGAHILSPGVLARASDAFSLFRAPFVATVPFHLGPKNQNFSVSEGYCQAVEDKMLSQSGWRLDGYKLFHCSGAFADGNGGWFGCLYESGCFAIRKKDYFSLAGFDERFQSRGGGLVNLDFFARALAEESLDYVMLLGEGSFHQVHGGVASNAPRHQHPWNDFHKEFVDIRGTPYKRVFRKPYQMGVLANETFDVLKHSATRAESHWKPGASIVQPPPA
jgi:hypothetical protein